MLWAPKDFVGYDHVTVRVMDRLYAAMPDMSEGKTENAERKLDLAKEAIDEVEEAVRTCMDGPWKALVEASSKLEVSVQDVWESLQRAEED